MVYLFDDMSDDEVEEDDEITEDDDYSDDDGDY